jgi:hypothetical protein
MTQWPAEPDDHTSRDIELSEPDSLGMAAVILHGREPSARRPSSGPSDEAKSFRPFRRRPARSSGT